MILKDNIYTVLKFLKYIYKKYLKTDLYNFCCHALQDNENNLHYFFN